eukprot:198858-Prymnesium_polylepis.2
MTSVALGAIIEVEVAEHGSVAWMPSKVQQLLVAGRFVACVNGDPGFLEEFGPEDEKREWRRIAPSALARATHAYNAASERWHAAMSGFGAAAATAADGTGGVATAAASDGA